MFAEIEDSLTICLIDKLAWYSYFTCLSSFFHQARSFSTSVVRQQLIQVSGWGGKGIIGGDEGWKMPQSGSF